MAHALALALHYNWHAGGEVLNSVGSRRLWAVSRWYLGPPRNTDGVFAPYIMICSDFKVRYAPGSGRWADIMLRVRFVPKAVMRIVGPKQRRELVRKRIEITIAGLKSVVV